MTILKDKASKGWEQINWNVERYWSLCPKGLHLAPVTGFNFCCHCISLIFSVPKLPSWDFLFLSLHPYGSLLIFVLFVGDLFQLFQFIFCLDFFRVFLGGGCVSFCWFVFWNHFVADYPYTSNPASASNVVFPILHGSTQQTFSIKTWPWTTDSSASGRRER